MGPLERASATARVPPARRQAKDSPWAPVQATVFAPAILSAKELGGLGDVQAHLVVGVASTLTAICERVGRSFQGRQRRQQARPGQRRVQPSP